MSAVWAWVVANPFGTGIAVLLFAMMVTYGLMFRRVRWLVRVAFLAAIALVACVFVFVTLHNIGMETVKKSVGGVFAAIFVLTLLDDMDRPRGGHRIDRSSRPVYDESGNRIN